METKNFNLITIEDVIIDIQDNPGITEPQINYSTAIGGSDAPAEGATKNTGALANLDAVDTDQIVAGAITKVKMALASVDADIIAANAITESKLYTEAVTADKIASNAVTSAKIMAGAIVAGKIAANAVTATEINVSSLSAISADIGTITSGTITGATIQTNDATYPYVKINSSGITVSGTSVLKFITSGGTTSCGYIGGDSTNGLEISNPNGGLYLYGRYGVEILASASDYVYISGQQIELSAANGGDITVDGGNIRPYSNAGADCGDSTHLWSNVYTLNLSLSGGNYINYTGGYIQSNSQFRVVGSINLTGNMTFENYSSLTIKDSGGTSRTLTCKYNSTIGAYILST